MPVDYSKYPKDWKQISRRIRFERAGGKCEWCGAENYQPHPITGAKVVLTVMHLDHDVNNNAEDNLKAACQKCHNSYDAKHRADNRKKKNPCKALVVVESKAVIQWRGKWWANGQPGPLLQRLVNELPEIEDGALWRLPMQVTGCKSMGQLDRDGWDYQNVKDRVAAVVLYAKGEQLKHRNHDNHRVVHNKIYQIPAKCG
jgi:hypothetical protein